MVILFRWKIFLRSATILVAHSAIMMSASAFAQTSSSPESRLKSQGITLPEPAKPVGNYVSYVRVGNLLYLAGHGPAPTSQWRGKGKVGTDLTTEQGYLFKGSV